MIKLRLKALCRERGLTLSELATKIGVSQSSISGFATGKIKPSFDTLERLCDALNAAPSELFETAPRILGRCPNCGAALSIRIDAAKPFASDTDKDGGKASTAAPSEQ